MKKGALDVNFFINCKEQPKYGHAFCEKHCQFMEKEMPEYRTTIRGFLEDIGADNGDRALKTLYSISSK